MIEFAASLGVLGRRGNCSGAVGTFGASEDDGAGDLDALDVPGRVIVVVARDFVAKLVFIVEYHESFYLFQIFLQLLDT